MATLKANGGALALYRHLPTGTRVAVCANGRVLINPGGANGWKRSSMTKDDLERAGYEVYWESGK